MGGRIFPNCLTGGASSFCIMSGPDIDCLMSKLFPCFPVICVMGKSGWAFTELM